jgi:hypothetical protein
MYNLINSNIHPILQQIQRDWVNEYDWLVSNLPDCDQPAYQRRYKVFWRLNAARLHDNFCKAYFQALQSARSIPPDLSNLTLALHATPTHGSGRRSLQFSFASKLLHMVSPSLPIYDSLVAAFYFYEEQNRKLLLQQRVASLVGFHNFLSSEYERILTHKLLGPSIAAFRNHFNPLHFTDEKIIDSLIWGYVSILKRGAVVEGQVSYQ